MADEQKLSIDPRYIADKLSVDPHIAAARLTVRMPGQQPVPAEATPDEGMRKTLKKAGVPMPAKRSKRK